MGVHRHKHFRLSYVVFYSRQDGSRIRAKPGTDWSERVWPNRGSPRKEELSFSPDLGLPRRDRRVQLSYVARHAFPVLSLREHLSGWVDEGAMRVTVALKLIHEPCCGIAQVSVHAVGTANWHRGAVGLALNVVVVGALEGSLEFHDLVWYRLVVAVNGLLA